MFNAKYVYSDKLGWAEARAFVGRKQVSYANLWRRLESGVWEIGWHTDMPYRNQGIMTHTAQLLLSMNLDVTIVAGMWDYNTASRRVAEKIGMVQQLHKQWYKDVDKAVVYVRPAEPVARIILSRARPITPVDNLIF